MDKNYKLELLNQVFSPITPIQEKDFFFGRMIQLEKIVEAINERGQHAILYGERGVGKTSLANIMNKQITNIYPVKITCDRKDTFKTLWESAFEKIQFAKTTAGIGFNSEKITEIESMEDYISSIPNLKTNHIINLLNSFGDDFKIMFIFDEFDNILNEKVRSSFADLIKSLSDNNTNSTIILVGIADNIEQLIGNHQSLERCLKQVKMPRMKNEECEEIIRNGISKLELKIEKKVLQNIIEFSSGFPHYVHLLCKYGCKELIENEKINFSEPYLTIAINKGIDNTSEQLRSSYKNAVLSSTSSDKWKHLLHACASCNLDQFNSFSITDIVKHYNLITKSVTKNNNLNYNINQLTTENRGEILSKLGKGKLTRYTFRNPMMRAFIKLKLNS